VADERQSEGLKDRLSRQGEEALGRLAEELAANSVVSSALASAFEARERAVAAQEAAMGALGIPSAADIERLTRRIRSVSQRLEGIEDSLDRLDERLAGLDGLGDRIDAVAETTDAGAGSNGLELRLEEIRADVAALREALDPTAQPVPRAQERLAVSEPEAASPPMPARPRSNRSGSGRRSSPSGKSGSGRSSARSSRSGGSTSPGSGSAS
jgi:chromosome segregation ATPase